MNDFTEAAGLRDYPLARRGMMMTSLISGFTLAIQRVEAQMITTSTDGLDAGEAKIPNADGRAVCRAVRSRGKVEPIFVERLEELAVPLRAVLLPDDVIVMMGAGHISAVAHELPARLGAGVEP